jgi:hypothetical protein
VWNIHLTWTFKYFLHAFYAFLLIIVVTKMYCLEANYTTLTQYRVSCTLLHAKYSLYLFVLRKRLWLRHSCIMSKAA